ncbi:MAG TPA: ROK family protein, partial [Nitrospiraceae bacterium]|nr:ROK family protein [Nitrospiraceae bacterium]
MAEGVTNNGRVQYRLPRVLVVDVGGTNLKILVTGKRAPRKVRSGPTMTAERMVEAVRQLAADWSYDVIALGYPGAVLHGRPAVEPKNLGDGWTALDFEMAFGCPVKVLNDAAMQALGSYEGGRMLFLGLGTGLGSALITDGVLVPMELAHLRYRKGRTYEDYVGLRGLKRYGKKKWRGYVCDVVPALQAALQADYVVLGGGNAKKLKHLPEGARLGDNTYAFSGGFRLWEEAWQDARPASVVWSGHMERTRSDAGRTRESRRGP